MGAFSSWRRSRPCRPCAPACRGDSPVGYPDGQRPPARPAQHSRNASSHRRTAAPRTGRSARGHPRRRRSCHVRRIDPYASDAITDVTLRIRPGSWPGEKYPPIWAGRCGDGGAGPADAVMVDLRGPAAMMAACAPWPFPRRWALGRMAWSGVRAGPDWPMPSSRGRGAGLAGWRVSGRSSSGWQPSRRAMPLASPTAAWAARVVTGGLLGVLGYPGGGPPGRLGRARSW